MGNEITSLSDDDEKENKEDKLTLLNDLQRKELNENGYCMMSDPLKDERNVFAVQGYIRHNFSENCMIPDLIRTIIHFYISRYNPDIYVELVCTNLSEKDDNKNDNYDEIGNFLVPKRNISLSGVLSARMESVGNRIEIDIKKVSIDNMHRVLKYLGHHKGKKPEEIAKPIRSIKMERIVADKWDAHYINSFSKKAIYQVILAANYLDCSCLLHLGSAKIATLIKGKSPDEIRNIYQEMQQPSTKKNTWKCIKCGLLNNEERKQCQGCFAVNDDNKKDKNNND